MTSVEIEDTGNPEIQILSSCFWIHEHKGHISQELTLAPFVCKEADWAGVWSAKGRAYEDVLSKCKSGNSKESERLTQDGKNRKA